MANDEIKPIEEIKNGATKLAENPPAPPPPPSAPIPDAKPVSSAEPPQIPTEPGKKSVIKRTGGEGGWVKYLILAIIILALGGLAFYYFFYQVTLNINPSPTPDRILLDNREVKPGIYRVKPGIHSLDIEKKGYVSYLSSRKYSFGQKIVLNFEFEKEKSPALSSDSGRLMSISEDKNFLFFLDNNNTIAYLNLNDQAGKTTQLSTIAYPSARILKISKDKTFGLVADSEALKIINFAKTDLINQTEVKLPMQISQIHSITWNNNESQFFSKANEKMLYDQKSSSSWDVFLDTPSHSEPNIIMQVDQNVLPQLSLDWGESPNQALVTGGELGVLDISKRDYKKISSEKKFIWGKWGPGGKRAIVVDSEGGVWSLAENKLEKLPFTSAPGLVDFIDASNIAAAMGARPIKYNFDTKLSTSYAEVKDLSQSVSFITKNDLFYFETVKGIFSGRFEEAPYK